MSTAAACRPARCAPRARGRGSAAGQRRGRRRAHDGDASHPAAGAALVRAARPAQAGLADRVDGPLARCERPCSSTRSMWEAAPSGSPRRRWTASRSSAPRPGWPSATSAATTRAWSLSHVTRTSLLGDASPARLAEPPTVSPGSRTSTTPARAGCSRRPASPRPTWSSWATSTATTSTCAWSPSSHGGCRPSCGWPTAGRSPATAPSRSAVGAGSTAAASVPT